jgi:hypothetical protein
MRTTQRPTTQRPTTRKPDCLAPNYAVSFSANEDAITNNHLTQECESIQIPFRTRNKGGVLYSHASTDARFYLVVYLRKGFINLIVKDSTGAEKSLEVANKQVDDGQLHKLDVKYEAGTGFLNVFVDEDSDDNKANHISLESPLFFNTYTIGYFNTEILSSKFLALENFKGCMEQIKFNNECLLNSNIDRSRLTCPVIPDPIVPPKKSCQSSCSNGASCVLDLNKQSHVLFMANEAGAKPNGGSGSIRLAFKSSDSEAKIQEILTVFNSDKTVRVFLSDGKLVVEIRGVNYSKFAVNLNDQKWHQLQLEKSNNEVLLEIIMMIN